MKRRGARVVSASSAVVPEVDAVNAVVISPAASTPTNAVAAMSSPLNVVAAAAVAQPALTIPTLNIFARFQEHRDDFDADWLLLKEDPAAAEEKPPLAAQVTDKLRRHQAQLGAQRAAAAADRSAVRLGKQKTTLNSNKGGTTTALVGDDDDADIATAIQAAPPSRRQRRPDTYDSAEDEPSVSAAVVADVNEGNSSNDGDDNEEYVPEDRKAAQYRHTNATSLEPTVASAVAVEETRQEAAEEATASVAAVVGEVAKSAEAEEEGEGLTGDYLDFQSTTPTGAKAIASGALQATVHLPVTTPSAPSSSGGRNTLQQQQQQQRRQRSSFGGASLPAEGRVVIVPLWSTARMEQHGGYCATNPLIALHQEVTDLVDFLRPTQAEVTMRRYIEMKIGKLVGRLWPGSRVLVYGSLYTHLLLPLSDLDVTLLDVPVPPEEALTTLAKEISNEGLCENAYPQVILKTKVPLIKFVHKGSLIDVDISVGAVDGKRNSECVVRYLNTYPEAVPLVMTVKYFLLQRGMHEPYHGGLGSYATTLLVVSFLRQHPIYTTHPEQRPMTGLGKLLVDFLRMCGQFWSYSRVAVSLGDLQLSASGDGRGSSDCGDFHARTDLDWTNRPQSPVSPSSPRTPLGPAQGSIADPADAANNAASSLRLFHSISSMFTYAYLALTADFSSSTSGNEPGTMSGSPPAASVDAQVSSPSIDDLSRRPTLLSRIFHVDADMIFHRQAIATTYAKLSTEMPVYMEEVRRFHGEEDAAMLPSNARSWRERRQLRRGGDGDAPFLWETQPPRSVTSLEERLALAHLHGATAAAPPAASTIPTERDSGNSWKRLRQDGDDDRSANEIRRGRRRTESSAKETYVVSSSASSSSSSESSSSRPSRSYDSDAESNASSVREDVTRTTERSRRMRRE
ncbi:topoisomerase-related function protein-like protein [Leptomonas pyrrhocoris]|uniref:Topoisomerase-related function protein-like protein n=1 Tax=Leptomonas pyrrhocoris TaxID=157538 RepID=A0A0M9FR07_LEPPY|nr:topoisomerase-related function protein-like protein [Leptomonas pyrrhocoris]KPA74300.1 topoisomerase-related function protein-like protein [Leptomonas pyrrhocoris]|eukprot:XP_015652739.1 topoisomerase-related function protein-like protein [Leptomonas pyrrhocoris]